MKKYYYYYGCLSSHSIEEKIYVSHEETDKYNFKLCYKFFSNLSLFKNDSLSKALERMGEGKEFINYIIRFLIKNDILNGRNHESEYIFLDYGDKEEVSNFFKMAQHNLYQRIYMDVNSSEIDEFNISSIYDDILKKSENKTYLDICKRNN
jgi:hypothetical protein